MLRRVMVVLSLLSLILCGITVVLWVRSYWVRDEFEWWRVPLSSEALVNGNEPDRLFKVRLTRGGVQLTWVREEPQWFFLDNRGSYRERPHARVAKEWKIGLRGEASTEFDAGPVAPRYGRWIDGTGEDARKLLLPLWLLTLATVIVAVACTKVRGRRIAQQAGLCPRCGFDLRATPGRCPECNWRAAEGDAR